jgi:hypothetical protein
MKTTRKDFDGKIVANGVGLDDRISFSNIATLTNVKIGKTGGGGAKHINFVILVLALLVLLQNFVQVFLVLRLLNFL